MFCSCDSIQSTRPEGSEARRTVSPLDRTPANGAGWGRASRQSDSSAARFVSSVYSVIL